MTFEVALSSKAPSQVSISFLKSEPEPLRFSPPKPYSLTVLDQSQQQILI
jgi:hypothetical protein